MAQLLQQQPNGNTITIEVEVKGRAFVTNPGDDGHVDLTAPPEVQASQRARRQQLREAWMEDMNRRECNG